MKNKWHLKWNGEDPIIYENDDKIAMLYTKTFCHKLAFPLPLTFETILNRGRLIESAPEMFGILTGIRKTLYYKKKINGGLNLMEARWYIKINKLFKYLKPKP